MLKKLNLVIVAAVAVGLAGLAVVMSRGRSGGDVVIKGKEIRIYGRDYTLAKLAQVAEALGEGEVLTYDAAKRQATAKASLVIYGSFQIGDPADPKLGERLLLDTVFCGDLRVEVARGGELRIYNSILQTVSQVITAEKCSRGYYFFTDGRLVAAGSKILYMSGARGETAGSRSQVELERTAFRLSDDCSFHTRNVDGKSFAARDSEFVCEGAYGVWVEGSGDAPVRLERCKLFGTDADLYLSGDRPKAVLVDCQFSRRKVRFQRNSGEATVRWTVIARVVERGSGKPVPGAEVVATGLGQRSEEAVRGRTGPDGTCPLVLTEYVATPASPSGDDPANVVTPHRLVALSAGNVLAEVTSHEVAGAGDVVTLEIPAAPPSSR